MKLTPRLAFGNSLWYHLEGQIQKSSVLSSSVGEPYTFFAGEEVYNTLVSNRIFASSMPEDEGSSYVLLNKPGSGPEYATGHFLVPLTANFPGADFVAFTVSRVNSDSSFIDNPYSIKCYSSTDAQSGLLTTYTSNLNVVTNRLSEDSRYGIEFKYWTHKPYLAEFNIPENTRSIEVSFYGDTSNSYTQGVYLEHLFAGKFFYQQITENRPKVSVENDSTNFKTPYGFSIFQSKKSRNSIKIEFPILNKDEAALLDTYLYTYGKEALSFLDPFYNQDEYQEFVYRGFYKPTAWGSLKRLNRTNRYSTNISFVEQVSTYLPVAPAAVRLPQGAGT